MTEPVVPIRAWAEYSEWSVFIDRYTGVDDRWYFDCYLIPKGREGACTGHGGFRGLVDFFTDLPKPLGSLQSLRVLLSNGHELRLEWTPYEWRWYIHAFRDDSEIPYGLFRDDNDAEAVQRALTAAAAYFNPTRTPEEQVTA